MNIQERSLFIRKDTPDCLEELFEMQNRICDLCGHEIQDLCLADLEHSTPVIHYARAWDVSIEDASRECNDSSNLRCAHRSCNRKKHDKTREEWFTLGWNNVDAPRFLTEKDLIAEKKRLAEYASMGGKIQGPILGRKMRENRMGIFAPDFDKSAGGKKGGATNRASGHIQKIGTDEGRRKACALGCVTRKKKDPGYMDKMRAKIDPEKQRQSAQRVGRMNVESGHLNHIANIQSAAKTEHGKRQGRVNVETGHIARLNARSDMSSIRSRGGTTQGNKNSKNGHMRKMHIANRAAALARFLKTVAWG